MVMAGMDQIDVARSDQFVLAGEPIASMERWFRDEDRNGGSYGRKRRTHSLYQLRRDEPSIRGRWWAKTDSENLESILSGFLSGFSAAIARQQSTLGPQSALLVHGSGAARRRHAAYRQLNLFGDVFEKIRSDYVEKPDEQKLVEAAINGMLTSLGLEPTSWNKSFRDTCRCRPRASSAASASK